MAAAELELHAFDSVASTLPSLVAAATGPWHVRHHRWGLKLWAGAEDEVARLHYELQLLGRRHVPEAKAFALEVGFHAELAGEANAAVAERLAAAEKTWRKALGEDATLGPFLGQPRWRRLSEVWLDPPIDAADCRFEMAERLATYAAVVQPLLADVTLVTGGSRRRARG